MKIYLDIFFLVNVEVDLLVLLLEHIFRRRKIRWKRLFVSALAGGLLSTIILVSGVHRHVWIFLPLYLLGSGSIVRLAFGKTTLRAWVINLFVFYLTAFLLSGLLMQFQSMFNTQGSMVFLLAVLLAAVGAACRTVPLLRREQERAAQLLEICLCYQEKKISGQGLLDTGNRLTEPFSQKPVAVGNRKWLEKLMSGEKPLMRYIPFRTVGKSNGMIAVFCADYIEVRTEKNQWIRTEKPWIAVSDNEISGEGEFDLILPPEMLKKQT
jgi:stage II sporulation protein GA (sporulation sigma-E factor processing peptidase)